MTTAPLELTERARELLRAREVRVTQPRLRVLAELIGAAEALSHLEVQRRLEQAPAAEPIDRVTLYRVLEWLVDIDLAILGAKPQRFDEYDAQVRQEYRWVPALLYHFRRKAVLRGFLDRQPLYATAALRDRLEDQARANLKRRLS